MDRRLFLLGPIIGVPTPTLAQQGPVYPGDDSDFVTDNTYPDNSLIARGSVIVKQWTVLNASDNVPWTDRFVSWRRKFGRNFQAEKWTPIPNTQPGEECLMSVIMKTPATAGHVKTYVKQVELFTYTRWGWRKVTHAEYLTMSFQERTRLVERILFPNLSGAYIEAIVT